MRRQILVTGGGGFLGRRIVEMLLARGDVVRVFCRGNYPDLEADGAELVRGDLRDEQAVAAACADMDAVCHVAAMAGIWGRREDFHQINVRGTANVLGGCLSQKVPVLLFTSSPSVAIGNEDICAGDESLPYPETYLADYPATKALAERMVLDANNWEMVSNTATPLPDAGGVRHLRTCALRPHLIYGPRDPHLIPRLLAAAGAGRLRRVGTGENLVDITYVDNAAHAHLQALDELFGEGKCAGRAYFIGDAEPVNLWEWINRLLTAVGLPPVRRRVPFRLAYALGAVLEAVHRAFPRLGEPRMTRFLAVQFARSHFFDHSAAERDFGYMPPVSGEQAWGELAKWCNRDSK
jgi:nucleoside-diphosphate-sugar epimerase